MESTQLAVGPQDLLNRIKQRVLGANNTEHGVIWHSGSNRVLILAESLQARVLRGWLLVSVGLQTDQTGRTLLEFVYFIGAPGEADGITAAVRINAATTEATQLAEVFGNDLQRVIWDAILDTIEVSLRTATRVFPNQPLTLRGFQAGPDGVLVDVLAGAL